MTAIFCKKTRFGSLVPLFLCLVGGLACGQETIDLDVNFKKGDLHRVKLQISHVGDVVVADFEEEDGEQKVLPLDVNAQLTYDQRYTGDSDRPQSIRYYHEASTAEIKINQQEAISDLSPTNRWIIARLRDKNQRYQVASIADVLNQTEMQLIKNPADPLSLSRVFNQREIKLRSQWSVPNQALATFLAVDRIYDNEVQLVLKELTEKTAKLYILGSVLAEVNDVSTEMEISGIAMINRQDNCVSGLRVNIRENRAAGQIAPGFEGQTKIDMTIAPLSEAPELSNERLSELAKTMKIEHRLKLESETGGFKLIYDPRWHVIATDEEAAILRFVNDGDLLAQCNIVQLPELATNRPLSMEQFKSDVERIIQKEESARVASFRQLTTTHGLAALRVIVEGVEQGVPLNWIYYHVAATDGRRLTFVFTLEKEVANLFLPADEALVNDLVFLSRTDAQASTATAAGEPVRK